MCIEGKSSSNYSDTVNKIPDAQRVAEKAYAEKAYGETLLKGVSHSAYAAEGTKSRLHRRLFDARNEAQRYERALAILTAHPEFEEFHELLNLNVL